jgi:hypothetical protein
MDRRSTRPTRRRHSLGIALVCAVTCASVAREGAAQTLVTAISDTLRGGVTVDGWGVAGSETSLSNGTFHLRLPMGSRVRRAVLVSATMAGTAMVPAGPAGNPRVVILGAGSSSTTRTLEGMPDFSVRSPTYGFFWGTWSTDVTMAVRALLATGGSAGGPLDVPVAERGDRSSMFPNYPFVLGHSLVVEYENDAAPLRNVVMYQGAANAGFMTTIPLPLPAPVANNCPASSPRSEPFAASLGIHFEWNVNEEDQPVRVNGMLVTSNAGGSDDSDSPSNAAMGIFSGLTTTGSFGGSDATSTLAVGAPVGLEGDNVLGAPMLPAGRRDDELYDFRPIIADGATSLTFAYSSSATQDDQMVGSLVIQTLARDMAGDADRDGHSDTTEGNCTVDTDMDGTPDYLDLDSDNDCLPDAREVGAARTAATMPGAPDANCTGSLTCDRTVGLCVCTRAAQCPSDAPICSPRSRSCVGCSSDTECAASYPSTPLCLMTGIRAGACVECRSDADCPMDRRTCVPTTGRCADGDADMDGLSDSTERRIGTDPMRADSDGDGIDDRAEVGDPMAPRNSDRDMLIDALDEDDDDDGILTREERTLDTSMGDDFDGDGVSSHLDTDSDGDGLLDRAEGVMDRDMDMRPDFLDPADDSDGDGVSNAIERGGCAGADGGADAGDGGAACVGSDRDTDMDGTPDFLDEDDDGDGIATAIERTLDPSMGDDFDMDGTPSYRDTDSDGDSVLDSVERGMDAMNPANSDRATDGPDFLDRDSDNDCAPDSDPREAGAARTDPRVPSMSASGNCSGATPMCDESTGMCVAAMMPDASSDAAPIEDVMLVADAGDDATSAMDSGRADSGVMDASVADAGGNVVSGAGACGCAVPGRSTGGRSSIVWLAVLSASVAVRARRRRER